MQNPNFAQKRTYADAFAWGALNVKFGIYVHQMTIFRGVLDTLEENYLLQLVLCNYACCMQLKNVAYNYFLVASNMCSCIKQVAKDNFSIGDNCPTYFSSPYYYLIF
jgi:hypothetical protein